MSLHPRDSYQVPEETARVARAIFPAGNLVMQMFDDLGVLFHDRDFADLFPTRGQPAEAPLRLALVTLLQFMEGLTDRQAADAVRTRIDWKYLLCLELTDSGFDHTVLSEFRTRLLGHAAERRLFEAILANAQARGWLKARGRQRTDSTHILGAIHVLTRIEVVSETLRHALNVLATIAPNWLRTQTDPAWPERYGQRLSEFGLPRAKSKRIAQVEQIGADGLALLSAVYADSAPVGLRELPAVEVLRQVWVQNFVLSHERLTWRDNANIPPAGRYIASAYDPDARYSMERQISWTGYKVHLTETCEEEQPNLITHVETTTAAVADDAVTETIHAALVQQQLLPSKHIADTGFVNSQLFVSSQQTYGIDLIGPTRGDNHWQAKSGAGFAARLCDGLGGPERDLPSRQDQSQLDTGHRSLQEPGDQDQVQRNRLPGLLPSDPVYALHPTPPDDHHSTAGTT